MLEKITHLFYRLFEAKPSGHIHRDPDPRDFKFGALFGFIPYQPKHQVWVVPTLSVKNQGSYNTCQWNAATVAKEILENKILSVRSLVNEGVQEGLVAGNGYSDIRAGAKVLRRWGILEEGAVDEMKGSNNWPIYSSIDTSIYDARASVNKDLADFWLDDRNDYFKCLDDCNVFCTAIDWCTGFNQGGGFQFPWLIKGNIGYSVGGHDFVCVGYDLDFGAYTQKKSDMGRKVLIFQNSYGTAWGDSRVFHTSENGTGKEILMQGLFYIDLAWFEKNNYGGIALIDMPKDQINKTILANIAKSNPNVVVNVQFINACYLCRYGRMPLPSELSLYKSQTVKQVANIILLDNSPFK